MGIGEENDVRHVLQNLEGVAAVTHTIDTAKPEDRLEVKLSIKNPLRSG
jgi:hypothetical protein